MGAESLPWQGSQWGHWLDFLIFPPIAAAGELCYNKF